MNEPKKRGRPTNAELAVREAMKKTKVAVVAGPIGVAQAYALRVWNGQSTDVPRNERLRRVAKALEGQGLSMEGVEL